MIDKTNESTEISSPFVRAERVALLMARSFAMMAMNKTDPNDTEDFQNVADLGMEIQHALMAHRAIFGRVNEPVAEA